MEYDPDFDGETYEPEHDEERLSKQFDDVFKFMRDSRWHTLKEIHAAGGGTEQGCSARLRDFRKFKFGGHEVLRRRLNGTGGTFEYRLIVNEDPQGKLFE